MDRLKLTFLFFILFSYFIYSASFQTTLSQSTSYTSDADKGSCTGSYADFFTTSITYSSEVKFSAVSSSDLIAPSSSLEFSVVDDTEDVSALISSSNVPELIYSESIYSLIPLSSLKSFTSKYFSDQEFSKFESDYSTCELRIFSPSVGCDKISGYAISSFSGKITCNNGDPEIRDTPVESYITSIEKGTENPGYYILQQNSNLVIVDNSKKKELSYLVCNGVVSFTASSQHDIDLSSLETISDTLPPSCFQPDANGYYSDSCDIPVQFYAKCYPVFSDFYGSGYVYSYVLYSPVTLSEDSILTITGLCHGTMDASISADSVTMAPGSSISYSFTVNNLGDIPVQITSSSDITLSNGFTFTPNANLEFPVIIEPFDSALIDGMLSSPSPMPDSFDISVTISPARNAVSCDGSDKITSTATVSVEEASLCSISLAIDYVSSLCKNQKNDVEILLINTEETDVIIDKYVFYLEDGTVFYDEPCSSDCLVEAYQEKQVILNDVNAPLTDDDSATFEIFYHKYDDETCSSSSTKSTPLRDCSTTISFDLYPGDENFYNAYEGFPVSASFKVFNSVDASDASPDAHVSYRLSSGDEIVEVDDIPVSSLEPGASTDDYITDSVNCEDRVTLEVWVEEIEGDTDTTNNYKEYIQDCSPPVEEEGVCSLTLNSQDVTGSTILMIPGGTVSLDINCFDVDEYGNKQMTDCSGTGSFSETGSSTLHGDLHKDTTSLVYDIFRILADSDSSDGDHKSFDILIEKSESGKIVTYKCNVDAETGVSECSYFI